MNLINQKKFSTVEALKFGFYIFVENILFFLALGTLSLIIISTGIFIATTIGYFPYLNTIIDSLREHHSAFMNILAVPQNYFQLDIRESNLVLFGTILFGLLIQLVYRFVALGIVRINLDLYDTRTSTLRHLFSGFPFLLKGFVAGILYALLVIFGLCLFVVPGIFFIIKYGYYQRIIVDTNAGIFESFGKSAQITNGSKWSIFGLLFIAVFLFLHLGFVITYPAILLAQTYVYRTLKAAHQKA